MNQKVKSNRYLKSENKKFPVDPFEIPSWAWPDNPQSNRIKVFRSREFLIQVFQEEQGIIRLSVNRTLVGSDGRWRADISWDELQWLKAKCGYADSDAVEIFPRDSNIVDVANMRHLWVMPGELPFGWKAGE